MNEESIFLTALEKTSVGERSAYLEEACAGDLELRARVEALITEHENPGSFLDGPPMAQNWCDLSQSTLLEQAGTVVGRYKLLEQIGEGGFGVVFMAEQLEPVRRNVAVKIIKPGMDSKPVIARFESERQALAMMDHQNIAKVLDAGTTDLGRPYFVMELVKGSPITQFCDDHKLTPDQRLELFIPACHAIQHAHQKGIIHRDIKPSNVLVCHFDGEPVPKVIDFGVAKAIDQRLTNQTVFTKFGQIIGTLEYMSPEQAEMSQLDIDTRSDIYSLGTLLYELLTGTTPFEADRLRSAAFDEMRRIIREEVPQLPSQRLTTIENLGAVTTKRRVDAQSLRRIVRGELDWIVMKSLEKQRTRRYESATDLARDIQRFLKREPVEAGPPSRAYQLRKFVSRNRATVVTACTLLAVLCLGIIGTSFGLARARNEAVKAGEFAERNMKLAESVQAAKRATEDQLRVVKAWGLTAYSQATRDRFPVRSLLLARESVAVTWRHDKTVTPIAHESLLNAVSDFGGRPLVGHGGGPGSLKGVWTLGISADGRWLVTGSLDGTVRLWDLKADDISGSSVELSGHAGVLTAAFITADSRWIVAGSWNRPIRRRGNVYLWDLHAKDPSKAPVLLPNDAGVSAAAASRNGRWLVTGSVDGAVRHWDLQAVDPSSSAVVLHDHEELTMAVAIDSTGRRIAAQNGVNLQLWNLTSDGIPHESYSLTAQKLAAGVLKISPDDRWLMSGGNDGSIVRWDLSSTPPSDSGTKLEGHTSAITSMSISTDSKWLATASFDKTVRLWDLTNTDRSVTSRLLWGHRDLVQTTAFSPDGRWLATGDRDAVVRVWDLKSENPVENVVELRGHERRIWAVKFTPDSRWLVTVGMDPTARMWAIGKDGPRVSSWIKHCAPVEITVSPNGRWLATGADDTLYLWDVSGEGVSFEPFAELRGHATNVSPRGDFTTSIAFSHDGHWMAAVDTKKQLARLWDLQSGGTLSAPLEFPHDGAVHAVAFSRDDGWLITGGGGPWREGFPPPGPGRVYLWDLRNDDPTSSASVLTGHDVAVCTIVTSSDGRWLASGGHGSDRVILWNLHSDDPPSSSRVISLPEKAEMLTLAISPDSKWLVTGVVDNHVRVWQLTESGPSASPIVLKSNTAPITLVTWSPNSRWLATGAHDGSLRLWDFSADELQSSAKVLPGHVREILSGTFSHDNRWLVTGARSDTARIWDLSVDDPASTAVALRSQSDGRYVAMTPNSRWLITAGMQSTQAWDLDIDSLLGRARRVAGRGLTEDEMRQYSLTAP